MKLRALALALAVSASSYAAPASAADKPAKASAAASAGYRVGDKLAPKPASEPAGGFKTTEWDDLMPKSWDPMQGINVQSFGRMRDGDPKAMEALDKLKRAWENAPTEPNIDNARIRIAGFVVPLDVDGEALHEFLLVPYFGACIHTPPPPSNQVIHVKLAMPIKGVRMMDAIWVSGQMHTLISDTSMGTAGYRMEGQSVSPYQGKR